MKTRELVHRLKEASTSRLIAEFADKITGARAKVYWDSAWREYVVKFYNSSGEHMDASDYHTDDKSDALGTAGLNHPDVVKMK